MKTDKLLQLIASANKDSKPLRRLQVGGQSYTSDSAYDLYTQTPPVVEYDPRATPEFQDLKKQYDRVQSRINTFVPVDPYVGNLRKTAAKLIEDQVTVET